MKKLFIICALAFLLVLPMASSAFTTLGSFETGINVTIRQLCASCTYNNITSITYPNGSLAQDEVAMNADGSEYTFGFDDTDIEGEYTINGIGDIGGTDTVWAYTFDITGTGNPVNDNYPFTLGVIILVIFGISVLFICLTDKMEQPGMKIFFMMLSFFFLIGTMGFGIITMQEMNVPEGISSGSTMILFALCMVLIVVMMYILIKITINALEMYKVKSGLKVEMESPY